MGPPAVLRKEPLIRPAHWFWEWWLHRNQFWAIPMPWRVVHVRRDMWSENRTALRETIIQHERVHYEQMERDGTLRWHFWYFYYAWKFGYRMNPYERRAYDRYGQEWFPEGKVV